MDVPINVENPDILRSYLNELNAIINGITVIHRSLNGSGVDYSIKQGALSANKEFLKFVDDTNKLSNEIKRLVEENLVTITKTKALATSVTEQFGSFSESALAASWYGLSVTAGGTVAGFTIGAIDTDTTTPGTEGSFFAIEADRFTVGKAHNLTPEEAQAVASSNENYLTLYDSQGFAVPAFGINYNSTTNRYEIYFNGTVNFVNIEGVPDYITENAFTTWLQDNYDELVGDMNILKAQTDGKIEYYFILSTAPDPANAWTTQALKLAHHGDIKYLTDTKVGYSYNYATGWVQLTNTQLLESVQIASAAKASADGKITTYYGTEANRVNYTGEPGDLYICSDNKKQYIWVTNWVYIDPAQAVNSGTTTISGGKIETDTLITKHIQANANGLIINSDIVGSSASPNIQGAYIKGGYMEAVELSTTYYAPKSWPKVKINSNLFCNLYNTFSLSIPYNGIKPGSATFTIYCYDNANSTEGNRLSTLSTDIRINISTNAFHINTTGTVEYRTSTSRVLIRRYNYLGANMVQLVDLIGTNNETYVVNLTAVNSSDYFIVTLIAEAGGTAGGIGTISWYN